MMDGEKEKRGIMANIGGNQGPVSVGGVIYCWGKKGGVGGGGGLI